MRSIIVGLGVVATILGAPGLLSAACEVDCHARYQDAVELCHVERAGAGSFSRCIRAAKQRLDSCVDACEG